MNTTRLPLDTPKRETMSKLFPTSNGDTSVGPSSFYVSRFEVTTDQNMGFEMVVPQRLQAVPDAKTLCALASPESGDLSVDVSLRRVARAMNPADLIEAELDNTRCYLIDRRYFPSKDGRLIDVLSKDSQGVISRRLTVQEGANLFTIRASAEASRFTEQAHEAFITVSSFRLLRPATHGCVEEMREFKQTQGSPVAFCYPESWQVRAHPMEDRLSIDLTSIYQGSLTGQMRVEVHNLTPATNPHTLLYSYVDSLKATGVHVSGCPIVPVPPPDGFDEASLYAPTASFEGNRYDAPVLLLRAGQTALLLGLIGMSKEHSAEWWAINRRAFEIVRDSLCVETP